MYIYIHVLYKAEKLSRIINILDFILLVKFESILVYNLEDPSILKWKEISS